MVMWDYSHTCVFLFCQWVEMSEKERIDKADRALRDASRNFAKRSLTDGAPAATNNTHQPQPNLPLKQQQQQQQQQKHHAAITDIALTTTGHQLTNAAPSTTVSATESGNVTPYPMSPAAVDSDGGAAGDSSTHLSQVFDDDTIFDSTEALQAALQPNQPKMPTPDLECSCGSLYESQAAMDLWANNNNNTHSSNSSGNNHQNNSSNSSLSVADLFVQQRCGVVEEGVEEKKDSKTTVTSHEQNTSNNNQSMNSSSLGRSTRTTARQVVDHSSIMSLDLFSIGGGGDLSMGDVHHRSRQRQHQQHVQSSTLSFLSNKSAMMLDGLFDEDMLSESFNRSLDFVPTTTAASTTSMK
jgi:hypothetical protein